MITTRHTISRRELTCGRCGGPVAAFYCRACGSDADTGIATVERDVLLTGDESIHCDPGELDITSCTFDGQPFVLEEGETADAREALYWARSEGDRP